MRAGGTRRVVDIVVWREGWTKNTSEGLGGGLESWQGVRPARLYCDVLGSMTDMFMLREGGLRSLDGWLIGSVCVNSVFSCASSM